MQNPSNGTRRAKVRNIKAIDPILAQPSAPTQFSEARAPHLLPQALLSENSYPPLPPHLDQLLNSPWTKEASIQVDLWLWYTNLEFGGGT